MFLERKYEILRWPDTSTTCRRWREWHVGTEEDGRRRHDGYGPEYV